jgi:hypothetical protein
MDIVPIHKASKMVKPVVEATQQIPKLVLSPNLKSVKNDSLQAFTVFLSTEKGCLEKTLAPGESIVVPEPYISEQIKTLHKRRIFKISNV